MPATEGPKSAIKKPNKVFLVHGRSDGPKHETARFIERLGMEAIILHERPNKGRSIIAKFQEEAEDTAFAVVLMTPDDEGGLAGTGVQAPRARQNVVFELGFFIGKLGAERVAALVHPGVERPSDFEAVVYIELDAAGAWKAALAKEFREAGLEFDAEKTFS
jgi:predicted nucleotide-binding protein